jgi:hypothetical protein
MMGVVMAAQTLPRSQSWIPVENFELVLLRETRKNFAFPLLVVLENLRFAD